MFIAQIEVTEYHYMSDEKVSIEIQLIESSTYEDASEKLHNFYKEKDSPYNVLHSINILSLNEIIS
jgi:hypothetical protein